MAMRMEMVKIVKFMRWGITSCVGADMGKPRNMGLKIVMMGMAKSRWDGCGLNSFHISFVANSKVSDVKKRVHST